MFRLALAFVLGLTIVPPANAQEDNKKYFYTRQECWTSNTALDLIVNQWGEEALFTGTGITLSQNGEPYTGGVMFFVNQETGSWTLATMYGDGSICISAAGSDFSPYISGTVTQR